MNPRRQFVYLVAILALLAATDFFGRMYVGRDPSMREVARHDLVPMPPSQDSEAIRKQLGRWLPALAGSAGLDQADPDAIEWQLQLVGVFRQDGERFALISAQPQGGGATELVRVAAGGQVHGATIEAIDGNMVTIREGEEQRQLPLFERGGGSVGAALPLPRATAVTPSMPSPAASETSPQRNASAEPAGRGRVVQPQELKPGEEIKLPWDLPVVEGQPAQPEKKR